MGLSLLGLAVGLTCFLVISTYVRAELNYDRFHEKADRIFRVGLDLPSSSSPRAGATLYPLADLFKAEFPEVEETVRIQRSGSPIVSSENLRDYEDRVFYAEATFFDIFDFELISGRPEELSQPNTVFVTPAMAEKYFGEANPIGERITIDNEIDLRVAGVVASAPLASHIQFDFLVAFDAMEIDESVAWSRLAFTYLLIRPGGIDEFEQSLSAFSERHLEPRLSNAQLSLIPLTRIHLFGNYSRDVQPQGDYRYILLFSGIALLILLIACVNYVTLVTARSTERTREVGIRKAVGATRRELITQFVGEAVVFASIAVVLAGLFMWMVMPSVETLLGRELSTWFDRGFLLMLGATLIGVVLVCGGYPALVLSRFMPVNIFSGTVSLSTPRLRRALVAFQFAVSIALIGGAMVIERQLTYVQEARLGFDPHNVLLIEAQGGLGEQAQALKQELQRHSGVARVSLAYSVPSRPFGVSWIGSDDEGDLQLPDGHQIMYDVNWGDYDFIATLEMDLIAGRDFSAELQSDQAAVVINETARDAIGWAEPLGKSVVGRTVIGVVRDFHVHSLHETIRPVFLFLDPEANNRVLIRLQGGDVSSTIDDISEIWASFHPSIPFNYSFLNEEFGAMYRAEQRLGRIFVLFAALAIVLACLGVFGVSAFTVQQRTKEIGIRKVLGASSGSVVLLLSKEFVVLVAVAAAIGAPLAYLFTSRWMENFAYRTPDWIAIIAAAVAVGFVVAMIAVGSQSLRAALANPADSLRHE